MNEVGNIALGKDFYLYSSTTLDQSRMQSLHVNLLCYSGSVIKIIILHLDVVVVFNCHDRKNRKIMYFVSTIIFAMQAVYAEGYAISVLL